MEGDKEEACLGETEGLNKNKIMHACVHIGMHTYDRLPTLNDSVVVIDVSTSGSSPGNHGN